MLAIFFFFSSRRRHTRFDCDWSSDVCYSDLLQERADNQRRQCAGKSADAKALSGADAAALESLSLRAAFGGRPLSFVRREERSEEHTSELQSQSNLVCRLLLEKKNRAVTASRLLPVSSLSNAATSGSSRARVELSPASMH